MTHWSPDERPAPHQSPRERRPIWRSLRLGWRRRCPRCGEGRVFAGYIKTMETCETCSLGLHHHRADDAPPYFVIMIVGHIVVPLALTAEQMWHPPSWQHFIVWIPMTLLLSLALLPRVKGSLIGLQWALRMGGFDDQGDARQP